MEDKQQRLAELLMATGHAHHQAFIATDGFDPEWPLWYSDYLKESLPTFLETQMSRSRIIHDLVWLDDTSDLTESHWTQVYAKALLEKYP